LGGLAAAAAVAALIFGATTFLTRRDASAPPAAAAPAAQEARAVTQFVLVAPDADSVVLVGDFNDWGLSSTRLVRQPGDGVWWVTVVLPPGRYRYAFIVDGTIWRSDPGSPAAEDEFGRPNSVITVGET
jgi:1,4-alpha-glucan branching enzyme